MAKGLLIFLSSCVLGINVVFLVFSFAALVYSGPISGYFYLGMMSFLVATIMVMVITALFSSLPTVIAITQNDTLPIFSIMALGAATTLSAHGESAISIVSTIFALIACTTFFTGTAFIVLGYLRVGNLLSFMPYPVIGGFLSAVGWFLLKGGFLLLVPHYDWSLSIFQPPILYLWGPAVIYLITLLLASKKIPLSFAITILGLLGFIVFYGLVYFLQIPIATLHHQGFLMPSMEHASMLQMITNSFSLSQVHWNFILSEIINILVIAILSSIAMMLNTTGMELLINKPIDINRELRVAGLATLVSGLVAGLPGYMAVSLSSVNYEIQTSFKNKTRLISLLTAAICTLGLVFADKIISYFPLFLLAGMVMFFGIYFLKTWLIDAFYKLPFWDYMILIVILLAAIYVGLLKGIMLGIMIAIIIFLIDFSSTKIIKAIFTGKNIHSSHQRQPEVQNHLLQQGNKILLVQIQQYLFFGNVKYLFQTIHTAINHKKEIHYIILDFSQVTGIDISAVRGFENINLMIKEKNIILIFANLNKRVDKIVKNNLLKHQENMKIFASYDSALEWCENQIIAAAHISESRSISFESTMAYFLKNQEEVKLLEKYTENIKLSAGEFLFHQGEVYRDLYYLKSGLIDIMLEFPNQEPLRLRTIGPGNTIGEIAFYTAQSRNASAIAKEDSELQKMSYEAFKRVSIQEPTLAIALHRYVINVLAERMAYSNKQLNILF